MWTKETSCLFQLLHCCRFIAQRKYYKTLTGHTVSMPYIPLLMRTYWKSNILMALCDMPVCFRDNHGACSSPGEVISERGWNEALPTRSALQESDV